MSNPNQSSHNKLLHHLGVAAGFIGLMAWYYIGDRLGLMQVFVDLLPSTHSGAALMLGIMLVMAPGFFIWKLYNRWLERHLGVKGRYYEDDFYVNETSKDKRP